MVSAQAATDSFSSLPTLPLCGHLARHHCTVHIWVGELRLTVIAWEGSIGFGEMVSCPAISNATRPWKIIVTGMNMDDHKTAQEE